MEPDASPADAPRVALLLIDVINDLRFDGAAGLLQDALPMAERLSGLKGAAKRAGVPVIYVNDNFGRWRSDFRHQVDRCLEPDSPGRPIVALLKPEPDDYFVLKPRHSGFFASALDLLLQSLGVRTLVLTGIAGNICVLYTANDAYMRAYDLIVAPDCTASNSPRLNDQALEQMECCLKARLIPSREIRFGEIC